ncbi:MAG: ABC transporter permease [Fidelibacterota bacterium]
MNFPVYIARKFMLGGKGAGPSRMNGWIAIIGLAVGSLAMVLSVAVLNGFESRVVNRIVGLEGDLRVSGIKSSEVEGIILKLQSVPEIQQTLPFQERKGLILGKQNEQRMVTFKALDMNAVRSFYDFRLQETAQTDSLPVLYLGDLIARRLNVGIEDKVRLLSPIDQGLGLTLPLQVQCTVGGIFQVKVLDFDDRLVFIPEAVGRRLFLRKRGIDGLDIRLTAYTDAEQVKEQLKLLIGNVHIETWKDLHQELFSAMQVERIGALAVLSLIIVVACFNLISTLTLITAQKIREFGILQVMGTRRRTIKNIILTQGILIGGVGSVTGLLLGIMLVAIQNHFGFLKLPEDVYFTPLLPMLLKGKDVAVILLISFFMILTAGYIAARRSFHISPKEAIYLEK